ncbi:MAG: aldo/keto reductase [Eubacteriales bacterium]|nr:aldo/keto reductase [Eubacteriales bacterium]
MIYKKVKRIDEQISALGVGCWNFGGDWDCSEDNNSDRIIHAAIDLGINFFDVAPVYGWYHSEEVLGKALEGGLREKVVIASKCGLLWDENHVTRNDLSKKSILEEIDGSLRRLRTDYIDIYQLHWPDHDTPIEETAEALLEIKKAGKIRHVGLSNFSQADVAAFEAIVPVDCQQGLYNMLERNTSSYHGIPLEYKTEDEMLVTVRRLGQAFLPYSPYMQGLLTGRFTKEYRFSPTDIRNQNPKFFGEAFDTYYAGYEKLQAFADSIGRPMNEICVNWLRQNDAVTSIIGGASNQKQLEANVRAMEWDLTEEELAVIAGIIEPFRTM